jgi:hypothetical protein
MTALSDASRIVREAKRLLESNDIQRIVIIDIHAYFKYLKEKEEVDEQLKNLGLRVSFNGEGIWDATRMRFLPWVDNTPDAFLKWLSQEAAG